MSTEAAAAPPQKSFFQRAGAYLKKKGQQAKAYAKAKQTEHLSCPQRKSEIAKLFVAEMRKLGAGSCAQGAANIEKDMGEFAEMFEAAATDAVANDRKVAVMIAMAYSSGQVPTGTTRLTRVLSALADPKVFDNAFAASITKMIAKESFKSLTGFCKCTNDCSDYYKVNCAHEADGGVDECTKYGQ